MGNVIDILDVLHEMTVPERVEYIICGFIRLNCSTMEKSYLPPEIMHICSKYTGVNKYNHYHLIKSKTELRYEAEAKAVHDKRTEQIRKRNAMDEGGPMYSEIKIVILGSGGVGKTTLHRMFTTGTFLEEYDPTIDDHYRPQTLIDDKPYLLDICDTQGQEEFCAMQNQFIRAGQVFLLVYDITRRDTFDELHGLMNRIDRIKDGDWFAVIAANKCDLEDQRQVASEEGQQLLGQRFVQFNDVFPNIICFETSAKLKINHKQIFYECVRWVVHGPCLRQKWECDRSGSQTGKVKQNHWCILL
eukprot:513372_1